MKKVRISILFLFSILLCLWGMLNPAEYVSQEYILFILSLNSIACFLYLNSSANDFKMQFKGKRIVTYLTGIIFNNFYSFSLLFILPFLISFPFLIALQFQLFAIVFFSSYLQNLLLIYLYQTFYKRKHVRYWQSFTALLIFSFTISTRFEMDNILLFNPLFSFSLLPYLQGYNLSILNVLLSFASVYVMIILINYFSKRLNKNYSY